MSANQDSTVKLNVGRAHYETSLTTINRSSILAKIVSDRWNPTPEGTNEPIFIDRDGQRFRYVLDYLRDGKVNLPVGESVKTFRTELQFFGIDILPDSITSDEDMEIVSFESRFQNHMRRLEEQTEASRRSYITQIEVSSRFYVAHLIAEDVVRKAVELQSRKCVNSVNSDISSDIIYTKGECKDLVYDVLQSLKEHENAAENEFVALVNSLIDNFKLEVAVAQIKKKEMCNLVRDILKTVKKKEKIMKEKIEKNEKFNPFPKYLVELRSADNPLKRNPIDSKKRARDEGSSPSLDIDDEGSSPSLDIDDEDSILSLEE